MFNDAALIFDIYLSLYISNLLAFTSLPRSRRYSMAWMAECTVIINNHLHINITVNSP